MKSGLKSFIVVVASVFLPTAMPYSSASGKKQSSSSLLSSSAIVTHSTNNHDRRSLLHRAVLSCVTTTCLNRPAVAAQQQPPASQDLKSEIKKAAETLNVLLENWERATVDCTFADVPRDLLQSQNKELLLEKASTYALFDKSVSVETCKTTNRIVRDYLGVTGKGPLVGMDKKLRAAINVYGINDLDEYIAEMEDFQQSMAKAASLSYMAGMADFDSVNNFAKGEQSAREDSNLQQTKRSIADAKASLDRMLSLLESST